jgi:hypothetical protein
VAGATLLARELAPAPPGRPDDAEAVVGGGPPKRPGGAGGEAAR